ncbi:MAG: NUDIX hydrolase [Holosporales bacterium]|jgi:ADP-ribose pyrophosphatase YjhB (NUDIX family)|nr:NUDIX hydrolase [Holosporales bacterium]
MHGKKLLDLLENYNPTDEGEIYSKQRLLSFLKEEPNCFKRENKAGHFTGSCWLENCDGTKFLLTKHKKLGVWWKLGGHADGDPDILNVSIREAVEESGLKKIKPVSYEIFDADYLVSPAYKEVPAHYHYDVTFLLRAYDKDEKIQISDESDDLKWFEEPPLDDGSELARAFVLKRTFEKWKRLR